jgi:glycogen debranching enzyme
LPEPVLDRSPELLTLYWTAWETAWEHVVHQPGVPQSPYLDEGFDPDVIWIWDTCFMAHFCKYAPDLFPGIESLQNFYAPLHDGVPSALQIQHPDNPPLFAWAEDEYVRHTGDLERVARVLDAGYLQRHFSWFDTVAAGTVLPCTRIPTAVTRRPEGYRWGAIQSGMDNTPRAGEPDRYGNSGGGILWFDAMAQQALAARSIARLALLVDRPGLADEYQARHQALCASLQHHWDDDDAVFYDRLDTVPYPFRRTRTPAAYWPLLAGACSPAQAQSLADLLNDPRGLGGPVPWPSVARDDPAFRADGQYWRGSVWVPLAYVSARALADHGHRELARSASTSLLEHLARTYADYSPSTIWEAYAPVAAAPATDKDGRTDVRPNFCGWSALGPISMLIEHVLGFRVDAATQTVHWDLDGEGRQGIRRLRCGAASLDAVADGNEVVVDTDHAITLVLGAREIRLGVGRHHLPRPSASPADHVRSRIEGS